MSGRVAALRRTVTRRGVALAAGSALAVAAVGAGAQPAAAAPAASGGDVEVAGAYIRCTTFQDGAWGKADCFNYGDHFGMVRIRVNCSAWYDPDVTGDWVGMDPGDSVQLAGNCWSAPTAIWTETM